MLSEAVADGVQSIVNVGCGTDTRHRFSHLFKHRDVRVLECDRAESHTCETKNCEAMAALAAH